VYVHPVAYHRRTRWSILLSRTYDAALEAGLEIGGAPVNAALSGAKWKVKSTRPMSPTSLDIAALPAS
jgi:hypothetical protein